MEGDMRRALAAFFAVIAFAGVAHADDWSVCNQTDDDDAIIRACSRIIAAGQESDDDLATAYNNRGLAYDGKEEHDRAIADFDRAIELNPDDAVAYDNRGYVYDAKGDQDRAIADYDKSIELDSGKAS